MYILKWSGCKHSSKLLNTREQMTGNVSTFQSSRLEGYIQVYILFLLLRENIGCGYLLEEA